MKMKEVFKMRKNFNNDYFFNFGYKYFGPLLLDFSIWLIKEINKNNINKVFFLSRDGYIVKEAFDLINNDKQILSSYFYASRRSITVPSFSSCNKPNEIFDLITLPNYLTIKTLIKRLGLEDTDLNVYLKKYNLKLDKNYSIDFIKKDKKMQEFLYNIFPLIKKNSAEEKENFIKYAKKKNFYIKVAIVDIGWYGTMQKSLKSILHNEIFGYYFGIIPNNRTDYHYKGFIFDNNYCINKYKQVHNFVDVFEFLFLAQHGSVKRFSINNIEFYKYEYQNCKEEIISKEIQKGALEYIKNTDKNKLNSKKSINEIINFFLKPKLIDAQNFGKIRFLNDEFNYIAKPQSIYKYILNINKFKYDFKKSGWRIGFLKNLFKIPLPYYIINNLIRKTLKKE